ncbi:MAG: hypothetical protein ACP59X_21530 [Solidesulfovibrio sp. DCME]|uniref:hypothetical protein n=1 Tax=Solidesulfovibrio sp. DCME TaxID=3447380 RepID=UPI003D0F22D1
MDSNKKFPKIKQAGVVQIRGKDVTTYESKLDYAHQYGIKSLKVEVLQVPSEQNGQMCFCKAELVTADDKVFSDIADASPSNVPRGCADSFPRIAATRAKGRVLSDAFNIKSVMIDDADMPPDGAGGGHIIDADYTDITDEKPQCNQAQNGGGFKPASEKQLALISSLARNQTVSPEDIANTLFGKSLSDLQGCEANKIIQELKVK